MVETVRQIEETYCRRTAVFVTVGEELIEYDSKTPNIRGNRKFTLSERLRGIPKTENKQFRDQD